MKILLITWACDRDDVSEPQISYRWVREISKRHEVTLFAVSRPERFGCVKNQFPNLYVIEWCDIRVPPFLERFRAIVKPGYFLYFKKARSFLKNLIQQNHFDIIHHLSPFAWRYASPAYGLGVPLVRGPLAGGLQTPKELAEELKQTPILHKILRNTDGYRKRTDKKLIDSYNHTDCVLVAAPYVSELLKPLPLKRVETEIELGFTPKAHKTVSIQNQSNNGKIQLLYVGRIIRTKGARDAIRAISHLTHKNDVSFTIIGDGDDLSFCKKEIRELKLENIITCKGWCDKSKVEQAYTEADIFLFPSFREPTGGVLLEAMSHGLPCVVCDYGGPAYVVPDDCGLRVPPSQPIEYTQIIATKIDLLVEDIQLRKQLGKGALRHAANHFNWESKMKRIDAIYDSLTNNALNLT